MDEVFYWLFNMSIVASLSGLIVLLISCVKEIPRRAISVLWIVPFLRMWIPVGIGSSYGLMSLISRFTTRTVVLYDSVEDATLSMTNFIMAANSYSPITYKVNLLENVFRVASAVWVVVFIALLITFTLIYIITQKELRDSQHFKDNIYISDKVTAPAVYGIIRPKIILPVGYENRDITFLLLHENAHISRRDNLRRVIAFLTASLHWFNPLTWVFLKHFLADLELSCDEKVLAKCGENQKKEYALSLLGEAAHKSVFASAFGGAKIRVRVHNILSYKKLSLISIVGMILIIASIMYALLTNAA